MAEIEGLQRKKPRKDNLMWLCCICLLKQVSETDSYTTARDPELRSKSKTELNCTENGWIDGWMLTTDLCLVFPKRHFMCKQ